MLRTLLFISTLCFAQGLLAQAPVVITQENATFNAPGDNPTWGFLEGSSLQMPERGENRTWDYSAAFTIEGSYYVDYKAPNNPEFPTATVAYDAYYSLNQFQLTGQAFYGAQASGEYYLGNSYDEATFDLGMGTLEIPAQTNHPNGGTDLQLPATMGSSWMAEEKLPVNTFLTVQAAGLNKAPLTYVQTRIYYDTIVGSGTLKMPGGGSYEALLKTRAWMQVDSFYLYGQPAPQQLLDMFGVQQGASTTGQYYAFYAPGVPTDLMTMSEENGMASASYRNDLSVSSVKEESNTGIAARLYPNPMTGEAFTLEFEKSSSTTWSVLLSNTLGETVKTISVAGGTGRTQVQINPEASTPNGIYYYEIRDERGQRTGVGSVVIERK